MLILMVEKINKEREYFADIWSTLESYWGDLYEKIKLGIQEVKRNAFTDLEKGIDVKYVKRILDTIYNNIKQLAKVKGLFRETKEKFTKLPSEEIENKEEMTEKIYNLIKDQNILMYNDKILNYQEKLLKYKEKLNYIKKSKFDSKIQT